MTTLRPTTRASTPSPSTGSTSIDGVKTRGGSWSPAATREVSVAELQAKFGWAEGSWEAGLLQAADAAGDKTRGRNGKVSAAELQAYLAAPTDGKYLTSTTLQQGRAALDAKLAASGTNTVDVDAFETKWQDDLAKRADRLGGNGDGELSQQELATYIQKSKMGQAEGAKWVPDQQMAAFQSRVAEAAGELDPLRPKGDSKGVGLVKQYSRAMMEEGKNVPAFVSYLLSASDIQETPAGVDRTQSTFVRDPELGRAGVVDSDYNNTGFDRGHMKPAEDSPNQEAMNESHLMSNIAPQHGNHNQQVWRTLEKGVNELVKATGGKAYIVTGNLYLDEKGKPLPADKVATTGAKSDRRIAVPTHNFKTVLLELPNGNLTMFAYMVPNLKDGPSKKEQIVPLLESTRVPVDRIEELLGQDLYAQLPKTVQTKLEKDPAAKGIFEQGSGYQAVTLLANQTKPAKK
ncbi:DNA/RNA non-specific endonuclease [Myxococcus stipitatus]|uniref:DNA/RNA non-specific endonuclease n=1 Tax=Myxococcus stipitatus TaxID=83455 RepID=UPI001F3EB1B1|nr:DNA/RNA non-specific endonuclease [Myxococcus stipitatus]MCE9667699.1 DNA/RNA non-specific endonuclease [Myxococcus stipitatus]